MNTNGAIARGLRHHYLFAALNEPQRAQILRHTHLRTFAAGELLFSQGGTAKTFFLLQSGAVKLYRMSPEGQSE